MSRSRAALRIDDLKIELGYALLSLVNSPDGSDRLTEQIKALRRSLAMEMGFLMPSVRILDNVQLEANAYIIKIKEVEAGVGRVWPGQHMVMDPAGGQVNLAGVHTTEPTFGLPATWVDAALKEEAAVRGYTVVDAATVLATHLTELIKVNVSELLSYAEVQKLIKELPKDQGELVKDIVPAQISHHRNPTRSAVSAQRAHFDPRPRHHPGGHRRRPLLHPQSGDAGRARTGAPRSPDLRPEYRRRPATCRSSRITRQMGAGLCRVASSARATTASSPCSRPSLTEFITLVRDRFEDAARQGEAPVLVTSPGIRSFVRSITERFRSQTTVLSQSEIHRGHGSRRSDPFRGRPVIKSNIMAGVCAIGQLPSNINPHWRIDNKVAGGAASGRRRQALSPSYR